MDLFLTLLATATAAYGVWYGAFARQFSARAPWTGRVKYRYKPGIHQRIIVSGASMVILIAGIAQIHRLLKAN